MLLLVLGALVAGFLGKLKIVAPAVQVYPEAAPSMWPFLFITIACGAISGFHSLVSSGTSAKQVAKEEDARFVGYGGMIMEGVLATLVIIAVAAGIGMAYQTKDAGILTGTAAWTAHYKFWTAAAGLGSRVNAFVEGAANMIAVLGIPKTFAIIIMGVFVASFACTTLDTAVRIQRYVVAELATAYRVRPLANNYGATGFAVVTAGVLALAQGGGKGGLILWPLFGTTNQLLAGLSLLVITLYLRRRRQVCAYAFYPMVFMIGMTGWAMVISLVNFVHDSSWHLVIIGGLVLVLELWMIAETIRALRSPGFATGPGEDA